MKKLLSILLLLSMLLATLASCQPSTGTGDTTTAGTAAESGMAPLTLISEGKTEFVVVHNLWETSKEPLLQGRIDTMVKNIEKKTGVKIKLKNSTDFKDSEDTFAILIGSTGTQASLDAAKGLRLNDFNIVRSGNKIVIVAGSLTSLTSAIIFFSEKVINPQLKDGTTVLFGEEHEKLFQANYGLQSFAVNGKELSEYTIVVSRNYTSAEFQTANFIRQIVGQLSGYDLPVEKDTKTFENEILVGNTARTTISANSVTGYKVEVTDQNVQIVAGCSSAYAFVERLFQTVYANSGALTSESGDGREEYAARNDAILGKTGDIRILFHNILSYIPDGDTEHINLTWRWNMQVNLYKDYGADLICLQEFNNLPRENSKGVKKLLDQMGYAEVPYDPQLDGDTPIFYRPEKFELLKYGTYVYTTPNNDNDRYGGYSKMTIWAIFKDLATGKVFGLASSHLDHQITADANARRASEALELIDLINNKICVGEYANIPMILGGDLNTSYHRENDLYGHTGALTNFEKVGGFIDVQTTLPGADQTGTWCDPPKYDDATDLMSPGMNLGDANASIDHCIYRGNATPTLFDVLDDNYARMASDHLPFVVDFKLN